MITADRGSRTPSCRSARSAAVPVAARSVSDPDRQNGRWHPRAAPPRGCVARQANVENRIARGAGRNVFRHPVTGVRGGTRRPICLQVGGLHRIGGQMEFSGPLPIQHRRCGKPHMRRAVAVRAPVPESHSSARQSLVLDAAKIRLWRSAGRPARRRSAGTERHRDIRGGKPEAVIEVQGRR